MSLDTTGMGSPDNNDIPVPEVNVNLELNFTNINREASSEQDAEDYIDKQDLDVLLSEYKLMNSAKNCIKNKVIGIEIVDTFSKMYSTLSRYGGTVHFWTDTFSRKCFSVKVGDGNNHIIKTYFDPQNVESFIVTIEAIIRWVEFVADKDNQPT